jgi:hypothetical protein
VSTQRRSVAYECNGCSQAGCPGHTLTLEARGNSDTVVVLIDGKPRYWFDDRAWEAAVEAWADLTAAAPAPRTHHPPAAPSPASEDL